MLSAGPVAMFPMKPRKAHAPWFSSTVMTSANW